MTTLLATPTELSIESELFWKQHIALLNASKLTRRAYCRQHRLSYDRFGYWLRKLSAEPKSPLVALKLTAPTKTMLPDVLGSLVLKDGRTLYIHDRQALMLILEVLS